MKVFFDNDCLLHNPPHEFLSGKPVPYFEAPIRVLNIREALSQHPTLFQISPIDPDTDINVREHILKVHTDDYLKYLESAYQEWIKDGGDKVRHFSRLTCHGLVLILI
jgi:acetoin utilization deacetylase AcuC-like enzyme